VYSARTVSWLKAQHMVLRPLALRFSNIFLSAMFPQNVAVPVLFNACMAVLVMAEEAGEVEARFASWNRTPPLVPQKHP